MKRVLSILVFIVFQGGAFAVAQPTPVNTHIQRSPMDKISIRLRQQNIQIQRDLKAGKLTKAQAKTLKGQVDAIRKQEVADLKANPSTSSVQAGKYLTDAQIAQLNEQLNALSKSIPIK